MSNLLRTYVRTVLTESSKWLGMSPTDILVDLKRLEGKNIIFFDTETTGLGPKQSQITEVAAMVVPLTGWQDKFVTAQSFHEKANLTPETINRADAHDAERVKKLANDPNYKPKTMSPRELLSMTNYGNHSKDYMDERDLLVAYSEWCESIPNKVYAAHNASFDMKMLNGRLRKYGENPIPKAEVLDTLTLVQLFLQPVIKAATPGGRTADMASKLDTGRKGLYKYSSRLGALAKASGVSIDNWHSADADVIMMMSVVAAVIDEIENGEYDSEKATKGSKFAQKRYFRRREKKYGKEKAAKKK